MRTILIVIGCMSPLLTTAQHLTGEAPFDDTVEQSVVITQFPKDINELPRRKTDLSHLMPEAGNQGDKTSCWAFATTYVYRSMLDNPGDKDWFLKPERIYSPEYTYQRYKKNQSGCSGTNHSYAILNQLLKDGAVPITLLPYTAACDVDITKVQPRAKLPQYTMEIGRDIHSMKRILAQGIPVIISMKVDTDFSDPNFSGTAPDEPVWKTFGDDNGFHAMVCVGYDEDRRVIRVLNSWGEEWGNKGYAYISYDVASPAMQYFCYVAKVPKTEGSVGTPNRQSEVDTLSGNEISGWFKRNYFIPFKNLNFVLAEFDKNKGSAIIQVTDGNFNILKSFYAEVKSSKEFYIDGDKYTFKFENVANAGNNPFNKKAVFFTVENVN